MEVQPPTFAHFSLINAIGLLNTPIQENFIYKKQGPSPISLVRATRIFSKAKTLKNFFDLSLEHLICNHFCY